MRSRAAATAVAIALATAACGGSPASSTPTSPAPVSMAGAYIETVIATMEANSVRRAHIDWPAFGTAVRAAAPGARSIAESAPAIREALTRLEDRHSFFQWASGEILPNPSAPQCAGGALAVHDLPSDVGYVYVAALRSTSAEDAATYAAGLERDIRAQDRSDVAGWIVDLRGNGGGHMWPMIAGLGALLGPGTAGFFVKPDGASTPWASPETRVVTRAGRRVAVLTGRGTASAGEAVAVAFRARSDTRSFGTETCGLPTSNSPFTFSDGSTLWLTTSRVADRTLRVYEGALQPDEVLAGPGDAVTRAIQWIRGR